MTRFLQALLLAVLAIGTSQAQGSKYTPLPAGESDPEALKRLAAMLGGNTSKPPPIDPKMMELFQKFLKDTENDPAARQRMIDAARQQIQENPDQFKNQLSGDNPLRDEQTKQLLQLMQAEKAALPPPLPTDQTQAPNKEMFTAENLDRQMKWMEDYNRRVLEGAGRILSPQQLQQYQSFQEQQASMQKLSLQMAKGMFGGERARGTRGAGPAR